MTSEEKCPVLLILLYIVAKSILFENNIKHITEKTYFPAKPRIIFKSNPILTQEGNTIYPTIVVITTRLNAAVRVAI